MRRKFVLPFLFLASCAFNCLSQNENLVQISPAYEANCEDISARIDQLLIAMQNNSGQGFAVVHGGSNKIENIYFARYIAAAKKFRGIDDKALEIITVPGSGKPKLEFLIGKHGTKPVFTATKFDFDLVGLAQPIPVAGDLFEIVRIDGKTTLLNVGCEACCIESVDSGILFQFLESNPQMKAYFVIRGRNAKRAAYVEQLLRIEAAKAGLSQRLLKFLYAGKNKVNNSRYFEVSVFLSSRVHRSPRALPSLIDGAW